METMKQIIKKANIVPLLRLVVQKEEGGVEGTGPHRVKLISDKPGKRINPRTGKEEYIVWLFVEEDGQQKKYPIPMKDENGEVHYLIQRLADFKEGEEVIMEYKRKGLKGYIDVRSAKEDEEEEQESPADVPDEFEIPIIEDDENPYEDMPENN